MLPYLGTRDLLPDCEPERPGISSTVVEAVETPTTAAPTDEKVFWLFVPTAIPVAAYDNNGLSGAFGGVTRTEIGGAAFIIEEGPIHSGLGLLERTTGVVAASVCVLLPVVMIPSLWIAFGNPWMFN